MHELRNQLPTTWNLCTLVEIRIFTYFSSFNTFFTEFNDGVSVAFLMLAEVCTLCFHLICSSKSDSNGLTGTQIHGKDTFPGLHGLCDSALQPEHLESTAIGKTSLPGSWQWVPRRLLFLLLLLPLLMMFLLQLWSMLSFGVNVAVWSLSLVSSFVIDVSSVVVCCCCCCCWLWWWSWWPCVSCFKLFRGIFNTTIRLAWIIANCSLTFWCNALHLQA